MRAMFLSEGAGKMFCVYNEKSVSKLNELTGIEKKVYIKEDVLREPAKFSAVEFIFATWGMPQFTEEEIKTCFPALKCIFYGAGSVQYFAHPFLACGVKVFSAWAANAVPVAELTVAQIVLSNKGYYQLGRLYRSKQQDIYSESFRSCHGNYGETVGIIGAGMIGSLVIRMLKAYDLNVLVFDPFLPDEKAAELGVEKCDLPMLFARSSVVSNHLANNAQTVGMLNYELFSKMREDAVFINTGRGAQVVEADLVRILQERNDLTALLDVTDPEPVEAGHPFYTLPNCFLTPHIAGSKGNEVARMGEYMLRECEAYLNGEACRYEVTAKMLETMA